MNCMVKFIERFQALSIEVQLPHEEFGDRGGSINRKEARDHKRSEP
jgi:hypothetical protein